MLQQEKKVVIQLLGMFGLIFALSMLSVFCFDDGGIANGIKYSMFQILGMYIPGIAILTVFRSGRLSQIEMVVYAFALGCGCSVLIYFFTVPFGMRDIMVYVYGAVAVISLIYIIYIYIIKKQGFNVENDEMGLRICCLIGIFLLILEIIMSCGLHTLPLDQETSAYQDYLFGVGNTIECSKEYPIINFRAIFQGKYYYHYMYNLHLAVMKIVLHMPAFHLTAFYSYMQTVILLVGASYLFFRNTLGKQKKSIVLGMVMVLFTTGYESVHRMTYPAHMYMTPNNFDIALAFGMLLVAVIYKQTKCEKLNIIYLLVSMISFVLSFGSKAPLGMMAACVCSILGLSYIVQKRNIKMILPYVFLFAILAITVYFGILSKNAERTVTVSSSQESGSIYYFGIMPEVKEWLQGILSGFPQILVQLLLSVYFSFVSYYPSFIIFIVGVIGFFIYYKNVELIDIALLVSVPIGVAITVMYSHFGGSQYYFLIGILPYAIALGLRGKGVICIHQKDGLCKKMLTYLCCFCALIGILNVNYAAEPIFMMKEFNRGVSFLIGRKVETETHHSWLANLVYPKEYEGYVWLRENTEEMDVLLSDMCIAGYTSYTYSEGVFSERYIYIPLEEDRDEIRACYQGEEKAIRKVIDKENVKYMIQTIRVTPDLTIPDSIGKVVFENDSMRIYELQK